MKQPINIIVADDSKIFREALAIALTTHNVSIIAEANNGQELLELLVCKNSFGEVAKPDVILLDLCMPVMDGNETFKKLNENFPHLKVIVLTLHTTECISKQYLLRGAKAFLDKNISILELVHCIKQVHSFGFYNNKKVNSEFEFEFEFEFTKRELEIIPLLCTNKTNEQIAKALSITVKTVEAHRNHIYHKTNTKNGNEFLKYALDKGMQFLEV